MMDDELKLECIKIAAEKVNTGSIELVIDAAKELYKYIKSE